MATMVSQDCLGFLASPALLAPKVTTEDLGPEANLVPTASAELLAKLESQVLLAPPVLPECRAMRDFADLLAFPAKAD
jgi:hypothetical protein